MGKLADGFAARRGSSPPFFLIALSQLGHAMRRIEIYDTTLRDGAQGEGVSFSLYDKLLITQRLDELGFDYVEGGYPLSNEKDAQYFERMKAKPTASAKVCAFGMTRRRDCSAADDVGMQALRDSGAPVCTIVGKTSAFHVREVLGVSLEENLAMIADSISFLRECGREVLYDAEHFFDGWKLDPDYALKTIQAAAAAGARLVVLCDTNGGSLPGEIRDLTTRAVAEMEKLGAGVGIHCHNDSELAIANTLAGVEAGACHVQGTINGLGERCGNADLISILANLVLKLDGYEVLQPGSVEHLAELSRFVYETANLRIRNGQPFVGPSAFAHKGGMHVHAVNKAASSYEHIDPAAVGAERRILVSELSGRSNIVALATKHNLQHDKALMQTILDQVVEMENRGYQFEAAGASFDLLVKRCAGAFEPHFERIHFRVNIEADAPEHVVTEATIKLRVDGVVCHEVAEGDGPVNALDAALRKALESFFPTLAGMQLVDYKVRVINSEAGTAAGVLVAIESKDEADVWGTVGVSENIIEASWIALVDSIEYKLYKDAVPVPRPSTPAAAAN